VTRRDPPNIGIVHEWLSAVGGSERVIEQILGVYPTAQLYALVDFLSKADRQIFEGRRVDTSFLQRMPFARKRFRGYLPLMPLAVEQFNLQSHDILISSNHAVAKGIITRPDQLHICYAHTPMRYAWDLQHQYLQESGLTRGLRSMLARTVLHYLRMWDQLSARRVDVFVANSHFIAGRIRKFYGRTAEVVYPPVNVDAFPLCRTKQDFYLTASRLVPYKKVDIIVDAFRMMPDKRLVVIGDGPMFKQCRARAPANVELLGYQPNDVLKHYMQQAKAFIFAAEEDFGITPVEAQACGTPVLAYGRGGSLETVIDGETGSFFAEQTAEAIADLVNDWESTAGHFDPNRIRAHACGFSQSRFRREFAELVQRHWTAWSRKPQLPVHDHQGFGFDDQSFDSEEGAEERAAVTCKGKS
jgi:glycosyltransferase involved in cell wall biosynthesis